MKSAADKIRRGSRQHQILKLWAQDKSRKEIAATLNLDLGTVNTYCDRLMRRFGTTRSGSTLWNYVSQLHPELKL